MPSYFLNPSDSMPSTGCCGRQPPSEPWQPRGGPDAPHVPGGSGAADVSEYLISLITGAPASQCNSITQGASVLLVLTGTPCWRKCFTKSHKSYSGLAAASITGGGGGGGGVRAGQAEGNCWTLAMCRKDLKVTNIYCRLVSVVSALGGNETTWWRWRRYVLNHLLFGKPGLSSPARRCVQQEEDVREHHTPPRPLLT